MFFLLGEKVRGACLGNDKTAKWPRFESILTLPAAQGKRKIGMRRIADLHYW